MLALLLAFAPLPFPKPDPTKADQAALKGRWRQVESASDRSGREKEGGQTTWEFDGTRIRILIGGTLNITWEYVLDGAASPKSLVMRHGKGSPDPCIYKIEGDTLTIAHAGKKPAPKSFDRKPGETHLVFKRIKP